MIAHTAPREITLTANRRLARHLIDQYDELQHKQGKEVWSLPSIVPLDEWLKSLWMEHPHDTRSLLTPYQEKILWNKIVCEKGQSTSFFNSGTLVPLIQQADQFLNQWNISLEQLEKYPVHEASLFFRSCVESFEQSCRDHNWISHSRIIPALMQDPYVHPNNVSAKITLAGFNDLYPQLSLFLEHLEKHWKIQKTFFSQPPKKGEACRIALPGLSDEIKYAAYWAKEQLEKFPENKIGCVFLNLSDIQQTVKHTFSQVLGHEQLFNLSLGQHLSEYPVIRAAIMALSFCIHQKIGLEELKEWLYSPFFMASEDEMFPRCELSARLFQQGANLIQLEQLLYLISKSNDACYSPKLANALKRVCAYLKTLEGISQFPDQWAKVFERLLNLLGWSGQRTLNSEEHQCVERFEKALEEFTRLNYLGEDITATAAFQAFCTLLEMTQFQTKSDPRSPIQIMGFLEASSISFDRLWVSGMNNENWPSKPQPNPFIPVELQRKVGMPHASASKEFTFCQQLTNSFLQSADQLIFSYSPAISDAAPSPSPLIKSLKEISIDNLLTLPQASQQIDLCDTLFEAHAPKLHPDEVVRGGTFILKHQASCPFRAFAQIRLGVVRQPKTSFGFSVLDRGNLIHKILEKFWKQVVKQKSLLDLDPEILKERLNELTLNVIEEIIQDRPWLKKEVLFVEIEKERAVSLIIQWLELEKNRDDFEVVELEKVLKINFLGVDLSLKIDRIDKTQNGHHIIIDYKTGKVSPNAWEGERPDEPQLPFYWVMSSMPIEAVVFAQIHPEAFKFKGVSQNSGILPSVASAQELFKEFPEMTWEELKAHWKQILENLFTDFCKGHAEISPKKGKETCESCGFQMLCRIHEQV